MLEAAKQPALLPDSEMEELEPVEISFGTIFSFRKNPAREFVVVDVGSEFSNDFDASEIIGNDKLGYPSTSRRSFIGKIYERRMSKEAILSGLDNGTKGGFIKSWELNVDAWSKKPSKVVR